MSPVGWGVVGCGWVARDYAIPAIRSAARLAAVYDRDPRACEGLDARRAETLESLVNDPAVQAVYVATPNDAHRTPALAAAAAGKAVLLEKPIATNIRDASEIIEACERAGVAYATAFDQRFHGAHQALRRLVENDALGTLTQARITYACWLPPDWAADNWRAEKDRAGGGAVIDLAPHGIDLIASVTGREPVAIHAMLQRAVHPYAVDDGGILSVRYTGNLLATLCVGYNCPDALPRRRLELAGTRGLAVAVNTMGQTAGGTLTFHGSVGGSYHVEFEDRPPFNAQVEAFSAHLSGAAYPGTPRGDLAQFKLLAQAIADA